MAISTTSHSAADADFVAAIAGSIKAWVYTEVISQDSDQTTIKYVFGFDQSSSYSDNQDFDAWINGSNQYSGTVLNDKGSGSFKYYEVNKVYGRPLYGNPATGYDARAQVSGIFNGPTSNTGTQNTDTDTPARAGTVLGPPVSFANTPQNSSQISYSWGAPSSAGIGPAATNYWLQVAYDTGFTSLVYSAWVGNTGSITISGLTRATTYYARVLDANSVGNSAWSGTIGATTYATVPDTMVAPTVGTATTSGFSVHFVTPNNGGSGITSYEIQVSTDNFSTIAATFTGVTSSPKVVTGLNPGVKYKSRARAINAIGGASWSPSSAEIQTLGGVKLWNGSAWIEGIVRVWNGSSWQVVVVRKWNGSSWIV